jgi:hypothetical protein
MLKKAFSLQTAPDSASKFDLFAEEGGELSDNKPIRQLINLTFFLK